MSPTFTVFFMIYMTLPTRADQECKGFISESGSHTKVQYKQKSRQGQISESVDIAEVYWKPFEMLGGADSCYNPSVAELLYKVVNSEEWTNAEAKQRTSGPYAYWSVEGIKPCLKYQFQIKINGETETAMFQLPGTLGPAEYDKILSSKFIPDPPKGVVTDVVGANSATISWEQSDCAEKYEINYVEPGKQNFQNLVVKDENDEDRLQTVIKNLNPCTKYLVTINAITGEEYSEDATIDIATKPRLDAVSDLKPDLEVTMNSMTLKWAAWENVSCINKYLITVCAVSTSECRETVVVEKLPSLPKISYLAEGLSPCTDYTVEIQPEFPDTTVEPKVFPFRTKSPDADTQQVGQVKAKAVTSGTMMVEWPHLPCATQYKVYQKKSKNVQDWMQVAETNEFAITVDNITPCVNYQFAVTAVMDEKETPMSLSDIVVSDLDEELPFEVPNLRILNGDRHADVTWHHADCISSYQIKVCETIDNCMEEVVETAPEMDEVKHRVENLTPCTQYTLEIVPIIEGKVFTARNSEFTTTNGVPQTPDNFKVDVSENREVKMSWTNVQCNTGFKIYIKTGKEDEETTIITDQLHYKFVDPIPCETYLYAVTTMVDEHESELSEWKTVIIPPRGDLPPELKILNNENDNMTLRLDPNDDNKKCKVEEYELTYGVSGNSLKTVTSRVEETESSNKDIVLSFSGASSDSAVVIGRVLFTAGGQAVWSAQVSTGLPDDSSSVTLLTHGVDQTSNTLVPSVVVGVVLAVIVLVIVIIIVVKKRRNSSNYDAEKAESGKQEETQKLNESHPDS